MKAITIFSVLILFMFFVNMASAVEYQQTKYFKNNTSKVLRIHAFIFYETQSAFAKDFLTSKPYQFYINYNIKLDSWNTNNPDYAVSWCNFTVNQNTQTNHLIVPIYSKIFYSGDSENNFYLQMTKGDSVTADMDCLYKNNTSLISPADFSIVTPTNECKACQFYQGTLIELKQNAIARTQSYNALNFNYIVSIFKLNFEFIIYLWWVFLILSFLIVILFSLIFIYYIYELIKRWSTRK